MQSGIYGKQCNVLSPNLLSNRLCSQLIFYMYCRMEHRRCELRLKLSGRKMEIALTKSWLSELQKTSFHWGPTSTKLGESQGEGEIHRSPSNSSIRTFQVFGPSCAFLWYPELELTIDKALHIPTTPSSSCLSTYASTVLRLMWPQEAKISFKILLTDPLSSFSTLIL